MRLTCPECGAIYEVPSEAVPSTGRDVKCSACEAVWYALPEDTSEIRAQFLGGGAVASPALEAVEETVEDIEEVETVEDVVSDQNAPDPVAPAVQKGLDPEVARILREEAAFEQEQRALEGAKSTSELSDVLHYKTEGAPAAAPLVSSVKSDRQVKEIKEEPVSVLDDQARYARSPEPAQTSMSGGVKTLLYAAVLVFIAGLFYRFAPEISQEAPGIAPLLESYSTAVDNAKAQLMPVIDNIRANVGALIGSSDP